MIVIKAFIKISFLLSILVAAVTLFAAPTLFKHIFFVLFFLSPIQLGVYFWAKHNHVLHAKHEIAYCIITLFSSFGLLTLLWQFRTLWFQPDAFDAIAYFALPVVSLSLGAPAYVFSKSMQAIKGKVI